MANILNSNDVNESYNNFIAQLSSIHDECFPFVRLSRKKMKDKPWITSAIKVSVRHKNILFHKYLKNPNPSLKSRITKYRYILKRLLINSEREYYQKLLNDRQSQSINSWKIINELINKKQKSNVSIKALQHDGKETKNNAQIADVFNTISRQ